MAHNYNKISLDSFLHAQDRGKKVVHFAFLCMDKMIYCEQQHVSYEALMGHESWYCFWMFWKKCQTCVRSEIYNLALLVRGLSRKKFINFEKLLSHLEYDTTLLLALAKWVDNLTKRPCSCHGGLLLNKSAIFSNHNESHDNAAFSNSNEWSACCIFFFLQQQQWKITKSALSCDAISSFKNLVKKNCFAAS